jgi:alpha-L-fucosidase
VGDVTLLGSAIKISFKQEADGLHLNLPAKPEGIYAYSFKITPAR